MGKGRSPFTAHEDDAILEGVRELGVGRWKQVKMRHGDVLKRRSGTDIKNHYYGYLVHSDLTTPVDSWLNMSMVFNYLTNGFQVLRHYCGVLSNDCTNDRDTIPMATLDTSVTEKMMADKKLEDESWRSDLATLQIVYFLIIPFLQFSINFLHQLVRLRHATLISGLWNNTRYQEITVLHHMSSTPQKRSFNNLPYSGLLCAIVDDTSEYRICKNLRMTNVIGKNSLSVNYDINDDDDDDEDIAEMKPIMEYEVSYDDDGIEHMDYDVDYDIYNGSEFMYLGSYNKSF
mmetsp:Transcript_13711/g.17232  ORF Transcript_13711/g.17232 Transcript_13711/m.17232 type:complete len:288 (-) Transcript_13711:170-1033(-)